ncbi:MAG: hypothetical protein QW548_01915 [Candidatus Aenigmatarchaeota archaeon]
MPAVSLDIRRELSRMEPYARELGGSADWEAVYRELYRSVLRTYWKEIYRGCYRGEIEVDGKRIALIELPKEYLPADVLGMTDGFSTIWLRDDLDEVFGYGARRRVLEHEKEHVRDPLASEQEVRRRTRTERIGAYPLN